MYTFIAVGLPCDCEVFCIFYDRASDLPSYICEVVILPVSWRGYPALKFGSEPEISTPINISLPHRRLSRSSRPLTTRRCSWQKCSAIQRCVAPPVTSVPHAAQSCDSTSPYPTLGDSRLKLFTRPGATSEDGSCKGPLLTLARLRQLSAMGLN